MKTPIVSRWLRVSLGVLFLSSVASVSVIVPAIANPPTLAQTPASAKKRLVIMDFDYGSTGVNSGYWSTYGGVGAAKGISELLINELVNNGTYTVVDRSRLEQLLKKRNITGPIDTATAVEVGKELGVDAVVIGTVTRFNIEKKSGGGGLFGVGGSSEQTKAYVQIDSRLISTKTGDILGTARGVGESSQGGGSVSIRGVSGSSSGSNEDNLMSQAVDKAVAQLVTKMAEISKQI